MGIVIGNRKVKPETVEKYLRAVKLYKERPISLATACKQAGISSLTYYKLKKLVPTS